MGVETFDNFSSESEESKKPESSQEKNKSEQNEISDDAFKKDQEEAQLNQNLAEEIKGEDKKKVEEAREGLSAENKEEDNKAENSQENKEGDFEKVKEEMRNKMLEKFNSKLDEMLSSEGYSSGDKNKQVLKAKRSLDSVMNAMNKNNKKVGNFVQVLNGIQMNSSRYLSKELIKDQEIKNVMFKGKNKAEKEALENMAQEFSQENGENISEEDVEKFVNDEYTEAKRKRDKSTGSGVQSQLHKI